MNLMHQRTRRVGTSVIEVIFIAVVALSNNVATSVSLKWLNSPPGDALHQPIDTLAAYPPVAVL